MLQTKDKSEKRSASEQQNASAVFLRAGWPFIDLSLV